MIRALARLSREHREAALRDWLSTRLAGYLGCSEIDPRTPLAQYGIDSLVALNLYGDVEEAFDLGVDVTLVLEFPTVDALARHLSGRIEGLAPTSPERKNP